MKTLLELGALDKRERCLVITYARIGPEFTNNDLYRVFPEIAKRYGYKLSPIRKNREGNIRNGNQRFCSKHAVYKNEKHVWDLLDWDGRDTYRVRNFASLYRAVEQWERTAVSMPIATKKSAPDPTLFDLTRLGKHGLS